MLIGIAGRARAGKDTIAEHLLLSEKFKDHIRYSFAKPLKAAVNELMGWDERHSDGDLKEVTDSVWNVSPRHAYQTLGTEWARNLINEDFWLIKASQELKKSEGKMILSDVRFPNEFEWIKQNGGTVVYVTRPGQMKIGQAAHASESHLLYLCENADHVFTNNDTRPVLQEKVREFFHKIA